MDFSTEMLDRNPAGKKIQLDLNSREGLATLEASLTPGSVECFTMFFGMRYLGFQEAVILKLLPLLAENGRIVLIDFQSLNHNEGIREFNPSLIMTPFMTRSLALGHCTYSKSMLFFDPEENLMRAPVNTLVISKKGKD